MASFRVFQHLNAPNAELYLAAISAFVAAKATFRLHMRPQEVLEAIGPQSDSLTIDEMDAALRQLSAWGNLESHPDTADATTVDEFLRARFLYQLSRAGEAAAESVRQFEMLVARTAQLQTAALADVRALLAELTLLAEQSEPDEAKVHLTLRNIWMRFGELTSEAQSFLGALQRTIDLRGADLGSLMAYKHKLIDYLERFIKELVVAGSDIADQLRRLNQATIQRLLRVAASRDLRDALDATERDREQATSLWLQRWNGLIAWFLGDSGSSPLAESLRARARAAIPALLSAIAGINENRLTRTDRAADLRTLARWFADSSSDADAHKLWRAAFGLSPARHLAVDQATLQRMDQEPVPARVSWLDATPVMISPRLRATGRYERMGSTTTVLDSSADREALARLAQEEARQVEAAMKRLSALGRVRLSHMRSLDPAEFQLFLDLLGDALAHIGQQHSVIEVGSADGTLRIRLEPTLDSVIAAIRTSDGILSGPDHFLTITSALTQSDLSEPQDAVTITVTAAARLEVLHAT